MVWIAFYVTASLLRQRHADAVLRHFRKSVKGSGKKITNASKWRIRIAFKRLASAQSSAGIRWPEAGGPAGNPGSDRSAD
jgi:hypothetical protein